MSKSLDTGERATLAPARMVRTKPSRSNLAVRTPGRRPASARRGKPGTRSAEALSVEQLVVAPQETGDPSDAVEAAPEVDALQLGEGAKRIYESHFAGLQEYDTESGMTRLEELIDAAFRASDRAVAAGTRAAFGAALLASGSGFRCMRRGAVEEPGARKLFHASAVESTTDPALSVSAERAVLLKAVSEVPSSLALEQAWPCFCMPVLKVGSWPACPPPYRAGCDGSGSHGDRQCAWRPISCPRWDSQAVPLRVRRLSHLPGQPPHALQARDHIPAVPSPESPGRSPARGTDLSPERRGGGTRRSTSQTRYEPERLDRRPGVHRMGPKGGRPTGDACAGREWSCFCLFSSGPRVPPLASPHANPSAPSPVLSHPDRVVRLRRSSSGSLMM